MLAMSTMRRAMFGLAIALGLGLVLTTQGTAQEERPGGGGFEKKSDKDKADVPNDGKKRYAIEFDRTPWKSVFEWLADISGLAFRNNDAPLPTGTFTFINPKVNGVKNTYTIAEIVEIINDGLAPRYLLLRRGTSFCVLAAGERIDKELVQQVTREELAHRGRNEIVILEVQLKTLNAEDLAPETKKYLGPFSEVTPLPSTNQMILMGKVEQLRRWLAIIEEDCCMGRFETYQHACRYVKASEAEKVLRDFLGDPKQVETTQRQSAVQPGGNGPGSASHGPTATMSKYRLFHIASDELTNTIYVNGPPEKVGQAKQLMAKYDVPRYGGSLNVPGPATFQTYSIPAGNADAIAKILSDVYKTSATLRLTATSDTVLLVYGLPSEHLQIATLLRPSNISPANGTKKGSGNRNGVRFDKKGPSSRLGFDRNDPPSFGRDMRGGRGREYDPEGRRGPSAFARDSRDRFWTDRDRERGPQTRGPQRGRPEPSRSFLESRLDRLIAKLEAIRREVRSRR